MGCTSKSCEWGLVIRGKQEMVAVVCSVVILIILIWTNIDPETLMSESVLGASWNCGSCNCRFWKINIDIAFSFLSFEIYVCDECHVAGLGMVFNIFKGSYLAGVGVDVVSPNHKPLMRILRYKKLKKMGGDWDILGLGNGIAMMM